MSAYSGSPSQLVLWADQLVNAANYVHVPVEILWGQFGIETRFGTYIDTSSAGAVGLMQFIRSTAALYNYPYTNYPDEKQSQTQMTAAALYDRDLYKQHGDWDSAIRAYSGGGYGLAEVQAMASTRALPAAGRPGVTPGLPVYFNPLGNANVVGERIDQGVDYGVRSGTLVAMARCVVTQISDSAWAPYGQYIEYQITQPGPIEGMHIYYAEGVRATTHVGEVVDGGHDICDLIPGWRYGIEIGWAAGTQDRTWARVYGGGYSEGDQTASGVQFSNIVELLGGPPGVMRQGIRGTAPPEGVNFIAQKAYLQTGATPFTLASPVDAGPFGFLIPRLDATSEIKDMFGQLNVHARTARTQTAAAVKDALATRYITTGGPR